MKKAFLISISLLFLGVSPAFATECESAECLPEKVQQSCTIEQSNGCIDWEKGIVYATGMGVPNSRMKSPAQKRYSAIEAAKVVAMRNLTGMVFDIQLSSSQTVEMGVLEKDVIKTEIHGTLRQVSQVGKARMTSDGAAFVTVKMYMKDLRSAFLKNEGVVDFAVSDEAVTNSTTAKVKAQKAPKASAVTYSGEKGTLYSGLILDARGTGVSPAMSPKVLSASGEEVYGSFVVSRKFALENGVSSYLKDMDKALNNDRVKGNPLVLKASKSATSKGADVTISNEDAELLKELAKSQTFMREARVIILL